MQRASFKARKLPYYINEQIKYIRANIQLCGDDKKIILFTSTTQDEGKSTLTLDVSKSMAELGKRVLLLDSDLRRSMMKHHLSERAGGRLGLSHYLSGIAGLDEVLIAMEEPTMYVILAGSPPPIRQSC